MDIMLDARNLRIEKETEANIIYWVFYGISNYVIDPVLKHFFSELKCYVVHYNYSRNNLQNFILYKLVCY